MANGRRERAGYGICYLDFWGGTKQIASCRIVSCRVGDDALCKGDKDNNNKEKRVLCHGGPRWFAASGVYIDLVVFPR